MLAERTIRAGEKLFDNYHFRGDPLPRGLKERRALLGDLFGGDYQCRRCMEQEDEERLARWVKGLLRGGLPWEILELL